MSRATQKNPIVALIAALAGTKRVVSTDKQARRFRKNQRRWNAKHKQEGE